MKRCEVLIAILKDPADLAILMKKKWYRIPVDVAKKRLKTCLPPVWIAFYNTKSFGPERYCIRYFGLVRKIRQVKRSTLFPKEPKNARSDKLYFQIFIEELIRLERPIISKRLRRIIFIPTTREKFEAATEINDLFDGSPLEDRLWLELKQRAIPAERQEYIQGEDGRYFLDFAVYCSEGSLDIETDGDVFHTKKADVAEDNRRDNDLEANGWRILRFNTKQITEEMQQYCIPKIITTINGLGGISRYPAQPRYIYSDDNPTRFQQSIFEDEE